MFYSTWRDIFKHLIAVSLIDTNNNIALSSIADTPDYTSNAGASLSTWTNANEVTGGANWPTGGINLSTGAYAPTITQSPSKTLMWDITNNIAIASTTTTAAAYGAYIYANGLSPKASIIGIWFGGTGYSTVAGTFSITWNVLGVATFVMASP